MKKLLFLFITILFFSCNAGTVRTITVDSTRIIGQRFDSNSLPYGVYGGFVDTYINGVRQFSFNAYYKGIVIVYFYNDEGYITDYHFSSFVNYEEAVKKIPLGSHFDEVVEIFGKPVSFYFWSDRNWGVERGSEADFISAWYRIREPCHGTSPRFTHWFVSFIFDLNWELLDIGRTRHWMP